MSKFCTYCGKAIQETSTYCPYCGKRVISNTSIPEQTEWILLRNNQLRVAENLPNQYKSMPRKKSNFAIFLMITALFILFIGIVVAFSARELVTTHIYDMDTASVPIGISGHVFVIMLFVLASDLLLLIANIKSSWSRLNTDNWLFHSTYALAGLFFSIATAFQARVNLLSRYYYDMKSAPAFFGGDVIGESWFRQLPDSADRFSSYAAIFYFLMFVALIITVVFMIRAVRSKH
ncbi:MAG: zinc-ribbon domain-containing protein [Clostridia bacterium]|nr:zinc-ribbon domain-containing protein [Clostridia bacterium]